MFQKIDDPIEKKQSYKIIDVSKKKTSYRRSCVIGSIYIGKYILNLIKEKKIEKGDPLLLAEIAGINAVKKTSDIIMLCHQLNIENVFLENIIDEENYIVYIYCVVCAHAKTGVEMEAMCGISAALLTIYDLTKKYNPFTKIKNIELLFKDGGENGLVLGSIENMPEKIKNFFSSKNLFINKFKIAVITLSDRATNGVYKDSSGQILSDFFLTKNIEILKKIILPDDKKILIKILKNTIKKKIPNIIFMSGGTGLSKKDITTEVILSLCEKFIPGIGEILRHEGEKYHKMSWLSNSIAGIYKNSIIISIPGNPSGVLESLNIIQNMLDHLIKIVNKK